MRCLKKNKQTVSFKNYLGKTQVVDSNGLKTGEYTESYSDLVTTKMNISPANGVASQKMFGITTGYSKVLITDDISCSLSETSIVWIDKPTTGPHDYIVRQVAKSLNSIAYAVSEVGNE